MEDNAEAQSWRELLIDIKQRGLEIAGPRRRRWRESAARDYHW
jgi:hypothetical protein